MSLVRVARFADLTEARVVEAALQAAGIPVMVQNAQFGQTDFLMQSALGGFGMMVPEEEAKAAAAFIREHRDTMPATLEFDDEPEPPEAYEDEAADDGEAWDEGKARRKRMWVRWLVVGIFFGPPVLLVLLVFVQSLIRIVTGD